MIYTSYIGNFRNFPKDKRLVSITNSQMKSVPFQAKMLAPSSVLLYDFKDGRLTEEEYTSKYKREVIENLDPEEFKNFFDECVLLCFCKSKKHEHWFCHRKILSEWMKENGIETTEIYNEKVT